MTTDAMKEMPLYQSHKQVWALKIADLRHTGNQGQESDGSLMMIPENKDYGPIKLPSEYVRKHNPKVGGYYVVYKDGYESWSPADAFEDGYSRVE